MTLEELKKILAENAAALKSEIIAEVKGNATADPSKNPAPVIPGQAKDGTGAADAVPFIVRRAKSNAERFAAQDPFKGKGLDFARVVRSIAIASAPGSGMSPMEAANDLGMKDIADAMEKQNKAARQKGLTESEFGAGGAFVPDEFSAEFIDLLTPSTVLGQLGAFSFSMSRQSLTIPRLTGGTTAEYIGESQAPALSQISTGAMQLNVKKLAAATVLSMDLLRDAALPAEAIVRNRLMRDWGLKMDITGLRSKGTQYRPKGLRYLMATGNLVSLSGSSTDYNVVFALLTSIIGRVEDANVGLDGCGWIMTPRVKRALAALAVTTGGDIHPFRKELEGPNPTLLGYKVKISNQIPNDLGTGGNESEIYFGQFRHLYIAENLGMQVAASNVAAYQQNNGQLRSAFSNDEMVIQVIGRHTFDVEHREAFAACPNFTVAA